MSGNVPSPLDGPEAFDLTDLAVTRLLRLYVLSQDRGESSAAEKSEKTGAIDRTVDATVDWARGQELPEHLANLRALGGSNDLTASLSGLLTKLGERIQPARGVSIAVEAFAELDWPNGVDWSEGQPQRARGEGLRLLGTDIGSIDVSALVGQHKVAVRRLRKDSMSLAAQGSIGAFMAGAAVVSGGAANLVGTAIGTHMMGLSGAAATSAGLAWLGGGSLASGGLGMAGGALFIGIAAHAGSSAGRVMLGAVLARESSGAFVSELAKLDVRLSYEPWLRDGALASLMDLKRQIDSELAGVRPATSERASRLWGHIKAAVEDPQSLNEHAQRLIDELPSGPERNLAASSRALDYELRHLTSPDWKRTAAKIPRFIGLPVATRLLDYLDD